MSQPVLECPTPWDEYCGCPHHAPCWPRPDTSCCEALQTDDQTPPEHAALIERTLRVAVEMLWRLAGKQFGACPVTVRPCRDDCGSQTYTARWTGYGWEPYLENGKMFNAYDYRTCKPSGCSCVELCEVTLPGPAEQILEVRLDGLVLDPSEYRVDDHRRLVRTSFGAFKLDQWLDMGGGVAVAGDLPANGVSWSGGVVVTDGVVFLPATPDPLGYLLNMGLPNRVQQRVRFELEPYAELTLPAGWTVEAIEPLDADSSVFQVTGSDPVQVRGGQFGGWVIVTGPGQSPEFLLPSGPNQAGQDRGGARVDYVSYVADGHPGCWPRCQDMTLPTTAEGTFSVTYRLGTPVPAGGLWAAGLLACELMKACGPNPGECALPANAQRIAREGVTLELEPFILDPSVMGRVGIPYVDAWLASVNPYKVAGRSRVYSPDKTMPRTTTWPCP